MSTERLTSEQIERVIADEVVRQDAEYGPFDSTVPSVRLALAVMQDEAAEALAAWAQWKNTRTEHPPDWYGVRQKTVQVAAIAVRLLRALDVELVD